MDRDTKATKIKEIITEFSNILDEKIDQKEEEIADKIDSVMLKLENDDSDEVLYFKDLITKNKDFLIKSQIQDLLEARHCLDLAYGYVKDYDFFMSSLLFKRAIENLKDSNIF